MSSTSEPQMEEQCQPIAFPQVSDAKAHNVVNVADASNRSERRQQEDAYKAGFARGRADGLASIQAEIGRRITSLDQTLDFLTKPSEMVDQEVEEHIVKLAIEVARQIVRREIKTDSGQVVSVVREAIASLPLNSESINLYLNPVDASYVKDALSLSDSEDRCKVIEDPVITRGGCRMSSGASEIDATLESQIAAISAQVFGGERDADDS